MPDNRLASGLFFLSSVLGGLMFPVAARAVLTVTPTTWNIVGLDSNSPAAGPKYFPVGARVCSNVATTNVVVNFVWDTANPNINLRAGSPSSLTLPSISAGGCAEAYFEIEVNQDVAAFDTARRYHITATDGSGVASTPIPRELYVEHLISQSRNSINDLRLNGTSIPAGGSMNLVVGNTYTIELDGGTATQGYNQFEAFINFPNTIFQILSVSTTYSADNSPFVPSPNPALYADACLWENDPNSPNYRACVGGDFKAGGTSVITTYTIKIISGGGTSQTLNTLLHDFSGSSYHYNADFSTGARIANIIDPASSTIAKSFAPNPTTVNGVSALTITLGNPNAGTLSGYNFVDNLPANLVVAATPGLTTTGCGTPTLTAAAGSSTISFSNGTLAANSTCIIKVNVTPTATGSLVNTTNNLFIGTLNTNKTATATLIANTAPPAPAPVCGLSLARWAFPTGFNVNAPAPTTANVTASASPGSGVVSIESTNSTTTADGTSSWGSNGSITTGATLVTANHDYFEFALNTTGYSTVFLAFDALRKTPNGPTGVAVFYGTTQPAAPAGSEPGTSAFNDPAAIGTQNNWFTFGSGNTIVLSGAGLNPSGTTFVRIYAYNSGSATPGSDINLDNVSFTGCAVPQPPTISKSFAPSPVAVGANSTLTFTVTNPNAGVTLTGIQFTDTLPAGLTVVGAVSAQCGGTLTTSAPSTISFSGGSLTSLASCTIPVTVTATTSGPHQNVSGFISSTEGGTNSGSTGVATATLTAVLPPVIDKQFGPNPILPGGTSILTFTITNPNQNDVLSGVAFSDIFPTSPGAMLVAAAPGASTSGCGAPVFAPVAAAPSISFSGGTIAGGGTCTVTVNVTATVTGTYNNTSGNVSHIINATTVNGNTASDSLSVVPGSPSVGLLKQVSSSAAGPWGPFLATTAGQNVFYRFTVENTGNVPLTNVSVADNTLPPASLAGCTAATLPVAVAANDNHIFICVVGPFTATTGSNTNTATATANGGTVTSPPDSATYATTGLTLAKSVTQTFYQAPGDVLNYSYLVTNSGFAPLAGPVTVSDNKAAVTCPAVSTVGDLDNFLDPGESITCTATYVITATDVSTGSVTNTASASAGGVSSPSASRTVNVRAADLSMVKTLVTSGPYSSGQTLTYTLFVANAGPSIATNVQVTDTTTNLTITNVSGGGCVALPCTILSLGSGANVTITVTATIVGNGSFDNSATVSATEIDPNTSNNTDNTGNGGSVSSADISVVKTLTTGGPFTVGQTISYSLLVANAGPSAATSIQVSDTPTNLSVTNVSGSGCAALPCTISNLASGANTSITVTATINAVGAFDNSTTVTAVEFDPNTTNNTDSTGNNGTAVASADISVVKTLTTGGPFTVGQTVSFTLVVANAGPSPATNVQVTDTPTNLTITTVSGSGCATLPCTIPNLAAGANTIVTVTATINAAGIFDNSTTVTATEFDPNTSNNTDNTGNGGTTGASADISVVKTLLTAGPFNPGQTISYTLLIANAGPSPATSIQVTDTPTNLTISSVAGGGCAALPCTIASLAVGANVTVILTATINAAGAFDNSTTVTATEFDPNTINNTDNAGNGGVTSITSVDVAITKTASAMTVFVGQTFDYIMVVRNNGPATATGVVVTDPLPPIFSLLQASSSQGSCTGTTNVTCTIGTMLNGASVTITLRGTVQSAGLLTNTATVTAIEAESVTTNNVASVAPVVLQGANIPTVSEVGLGLMTLLLAMTGALIIRRF